MEKLRKRGMLVSMFVLLITFAFTTTAAAQRILGGGEDTATGQWVIMTYYGPDNWNVPGPRPVTPIRGNGVSFDFYETPDRAMLITEIGTAKKSNLTGKILSADIAIEATPGATFNYYDNTTGGAPTGGFVRLYFNKVNTEGCPTGWHPERPDCEAQYWWSNPLHIDLADLAALGKKGIRLEVSLDPQFWSDRDGHMGTDTTSNAVDHTDAFNAAVANVHKIGLSFGGAGWWAFGCGVNETSTAWFNLYRFIVKSPY